MKSLLISLLLFSFAQIAQADVVELSEGQSKKLFNVLADFGLQEAYPAELQTRQWAKPAVCVKEATGGDVSYGCQLNDEIRNVNVQKTGSAAKKLYKIIEDVNDADCEDGVCIIFAPEIQCVYWWLNKDNPPSRRYRCVIEKQVSSPN